MAVQYNFLDNSFTEFENVENPKVTYKAPLIDDAFDITSGFSRVSLSGTPIARNTFSSELNVNNSEEHIPLQISYSQLQTQLFEQKQNLLGRKKLAMEYFLNKTDDNGKPILKPHQVAGLVGNLMRESSLNPNIVNKSSKAYGLALWLGDRKKKLIAKYGNNPTFEQLLDFIWEELNSTHKKGLETLKNSSSVDEAAANAFGWFEFSVGPKKAIAEMKKYGQDGLKSYEQGIKYAKSLLA